MTHHEGEGPAMPAHGEFCWHEIATTEIEKCKSFYSNVFGWDFIQSTASGEDHAYLEFSSAGDGQPDGALFGMTPEMFGGEVPPAHIAIYVAVDDIDASTAKAAELGAAILNGPFDIPNVGRMSVINDPTGAMISMITLKEGGHHE
jgi:uncharacterized protein